MGQKADVYCAPHRSMVGYWARELTNLGHQVPAEAWLRHEGITAYASYRFNIFDHAGWTRKTKSAFIYLWQTPNRQPLDKRDLHVAISFSQINRAAVQELNKTR
jgi:hypothetical protein